MGVIFLLGLVIYVAFRTPPVQRYVTGLIADQLSKQIGTKVELGGIDIDFFEGVALSGVYIEDQQQDTLLYAGEVAAYIEPAALLNSTAAIKLVEIHDTYINLYQPEGQEDLNFNFIVEAFASEDTTTTDTTSSSWTIELYRVLLDDIRFDYNAEGTEMALALNQLNMVFESLGLEESYIQGDELNVDGLTFAFVQAPSSSAPDTTAVSPVESDSAANVINPSGFAYSLNTLNIENSQIAYRVKGPGGDSVMQQINFENMIADQINLLAQDIEVGETSASGEIEDFSFVETKSGFRLDQLAVSTAVDMPTVQGKLTDLKTNHSKINGNLAFSITLADDMTTMMNSLTVDSRLNNTVVGLADATYFTNALDSMPAVRELSPQISWQVDIADGKGDIQNLLVDVNDETMLQASASFRDLGALDDAVNGSPYFEAQVQEFRTDLAFLDQFIPPSSQQYIPQMRDNTLSMTAEAKGRLDDLAANVTLRSGLGTLVAEANYAQPDPQHTNIQADLQADQFDLPPVLKLFAGDSVARDFGRLSFHTTADVQQVATPTDTTLSRALVQLVVDELTYKNYTYEDLKVQGQMVDDVLEADIQYEDSLLNLLATAEANLDQEDYKVNMRLQNANLFRLNLVSDSIIIANTELVADIHGTDPDQLVGFAKVNNIDVIRGRQEYRMDSLSFRATKSDDLRTFTLYTDYIEAIISGQFTVAELPTAIENFQQYYFASFEAPTTLDRDTVKTQQANSQNINVQLTIEKTPKLAQAFVPDLDIPEPLSVEANFNSREKSLQVDMNVPHAGYGTNTVDSLRAQVNTNQRKISFDVAASSAQASGFVFPQVELQGDLYGEEADNPAPGQQPLATTAVDANFKVGRSDSPFRLDLTTNVRTRGDTVAVTLPDLELVVQDKPWNLPRGASVKYATEYLDINNLILQQEDQEIAIMTDNQNGRSDLKVMIEQLLLNPLLEAFHLEEYNVKGALSGQATVQNLFVPGVINAELGIAGLSIQDTTVGDFVVKVEKDSPVKDEPELVSILTTLKGQNNDLIVEGNYNLSSEENALDFQATLNKFTLSPWQPLMEEYLKEAKGTLKADLALSGSTTAPNIDGFFAFADQVVLVPAATGAVIYVNDQRIQFNNDQVQFNNFTMLDSARREAVLDGNIDIASLTNPAFDLVFQTDDFVFVNSEEYDNESFYGKAVLGTDVTIEGPLEQLMVEGDIRVDEGTDLAISVASGPESAAQAEFITFINTNKFVQADTVLQDSLRRDSLNLAQSTQEQPALEQDTLGVSGIAVSTEVHINPEAVFTIIIDPATGDKLIASGEADLKVDQNFSGELNMQGTYLVGSGSYSLNFAGVVDREFTLQEGGTIIWTGEPDNADLDLTAIYTTETSLEELGAPSIDDAPVEVLLEITGTIEFPELAFNVNVPNLEDLPAGQQVVVREKINLLKQNETDLYKQVFGLIVLGRFIPSGGGLASGGGGGGGSFVDDRINSSVSQLLSSQLSRLTEDYLGGVELKVGVESGEQGETGAVAGRDVDVALSRELFDDRLSVTVGGTTASGSGDDAGGSGGGFMGEFEVLYRITENGNLNLKAFQNTDRNELTNQIQNNAGVSLLYQNSFNKFFEKEGETLKSKKLLDEEERDSGQEEENEEPSESVSEDVRRRRKNGGQ